MENVTLKLFMWALLLAGVYALATFIVPMQDLLQVMNGVFLGIMVLVIAIYSPLLLRIIYTNRFDRVSQITLAIALLWFSLGLNRIWWSIFHYLDSPQELLNNATVGVVILIGIVSGALFASAPGIPSSDIQPIVLGGFNRKLILIFGLTGGVIAVLLLKIINLT